MRQRGIVLVIARARGERVNRERREVFSSILLAHRDEIGHPDPALAVDVAYTMYAAVGSRMREIATMRALGFRR